MQAWGRAREVEKVKRFDVDVDVRAALAVVGQEVMGARRKFKPFNSAHEGYSVILEELDELWEEVKKKSNNRDKAAMKKEVIQVAAMAIRFLTDV